MLRHLLAFLGLDDPYADAKRAARLTEVEALSIARQAGAKVPDVHTLEFVALIERGGERLWVFATTSRGKHWEVKVRDSDGKVVSKGGVGIR